LETKITNDIFDNALQKALENAKNCNISLQKIQILLKNLGYVKDSSDLNDLIQDFSKKTYMNIFNIQYLQELELMYRIKKSGEKSINKANIITAIIIISTIISFLFEIYFILFFIIN